MYGVQDVEPEQTAGRRAENLQRIAALGRRRREDRLPGLRRLAFAAALLYEVMQGAEQSASA